MLCSAQYEVSSAIRTSPGAATGVQIMVHRGYALHRHGFSNGITHVDVRRRQEPRSIYRPARPAPPFHLQPTTTCFGVNAPSVWTWQSFRTRSLFRRVARDSSRTKPVHLGHPRLRHLQAEKPAEIGFMPVEGSARPHLVHGRALRLCLHPLRRFHRSHLCGHRHVRPRKPQVVGAGASRHVARGR